MTQQKTKTTGLIKRKLWRKPWIWIVASIVIILVVAAIVIGVLLARSHKNEIAMSAMTPAQSRSEIYDLYIATRNLLGGTWGGAENSWLQCTTTSGDQNGATFNLAVDRRDQTVDGGPVAVAQKVQSLWAAQGYKAEIAEDKTLTPTLYALSDPPFLSGSGPDGFLLQLIIKGNVISFNGTSRCVSADIQNLNFAEQKIPDWTSTSTSSTQ